MKKFSAAVRRIFLAAFLILLLVICITRIDLKTNIGTLLCLGCLGTGCIYLVVSLISIIVRIISKKRMDERDAMIETMVGVAYLNANNSLIHFFRRLSFWGVIMLLVNIFALNVSTDIIINATSSTDAFLAGYYGFLIWSVIALVITFVISVLFWIIYMPHYGTGTYNIFQFIGKTIGNDIVTPVRVLKLSFTKNTEGKRNFSRVFNLIIMILFIAVNVIAILKTI